MRNLKALAVAIVLLFLHVTCTKSSLEPPLPKTTDPKTASNESSVITVTPVTYLIPQGQQYCQPNPLVFTTANKLVFAAIFDSSCIYKTIDPVNQYDINKLYGFSDCNTHHLENSARVGWRWSNDSLRLFGYVHNNGSILSKEITTAPIGKTIRCKIVCNDTAYIFTVMGKTATLPRHCAGKYNRYKLYPYFGGDEVAPHNITIQLADLK